MVILSILLPTYNPVIDWLTQAIESVVAQTYPHWELCIADDASTDPEVRELLREYSRRDNRIKVCFRETNGHISNASNSALELVAGDWVLLMDHDDIIPPNALQDFADVITSNPSVRMIYSDEDKISSTGDHYFPNYKPDWNPDLFLSCNMISHLTAYRTDLLRETGGFREGYEGAQDYDITLRYIKKIRHNEIYHIPKLLYHWRCHEGSTAASGEAKPYAVMAGKRALADYLVGSRPEGRVEELEWGAYSVVYDNLASSSDILHVVLAGGNHALLKRCLDSVSNTSPDSLSSIAILPHSKKAREKLKSYELPAGAFIAELSSGLSVAESLNQIVAGAGASLISFLGDSLECLDETALQKMASQALRPDIGAVGGMILYADGRVRSAGLLLDPRTIFKNAFHHWPGVSWGYMGRLTLNQNYSAVSGKCLVVERDKFLQVGGFDSMNLNTRYLYVDLCLRLGEAGYRTLWTPKARFTDHSPRFSVGNMLRRLSKRSCKDREWMVKRWGDILSKDPAYNPNLNQKKKDFNFKWPPQEC